MVEIDHPEIDAQALLARLRAIDARASRAPAPTPAAEAPRPVIAERPALDGHIDAARKTWM